MNQDELKRVKDKIAAMSERTTDNGCTEAEAMIAMKKVGELLDAYNLTMNDVLLRNETYVTKTYDTGRKNKHPIAFVIPVISKFCGTRSWNSYRYEGRKKFLIVKFFGTESDTEMSMYLTSMIWKMMDAETARYRATPAYKNSDTHGRALSTSFQNGMVNRINARLRELIAERDAISATTGRELIIIKGQLTEQKFKELGMKLRPGTYASRISHSSSYSKGQDAGSRVNLSRPITANRPDVKMIGGR